MPNAREEWCRANDARVADRARIRHPLQRDGSAFSCLPMLFYERYQHDNNCNTDNRSPEEIRRARIKSEGPDPIRVSLGIRVHIAERKGQPPEPAADDVRLISWPI